MKKCYSLFIISLIFNSLCFGDTITLNVENDIFNHSDGEYTHGTKLTYQSDSNWGLTAGQNVYTPDNTNIEELQPNDRPYAGWLYAGPTYHRVNDNKIDRIELNLGVVGPSSFGEDVQVAVHDALNNKAPKGWDNQLSDEFGVLLTYRRTFILDAEDGMIFLPHYGGTAGNVQTYINAGFSFVYGTAVPNEYTPFIITPTSQTHKLGVYAFGQVDAKVVAHNIFLDGNTFADSHSVEKEIFVGDFTFGVGVKYNNTQLRLSHSQRTEEFKKQDDGEGWNTLSISYSF